jgi:hypothetical protein
VRRPTWSPCGFKYREHPASALGPAKYKTKSIRIVSIFPRWDGIVIPQEPDTLGPSPSMELQQFILPLTGQILTHQLGNSRMSKRDHTCVHICEFSTIILP